MILYLFKGIKLVLSNEVYIYINTYLNASIHIHLFLRYNCITQNFIEISIFFGFGSLIL